MKQILLMIISILLIRGTTFVQNSSPFKVDVRKFGEVYIEARKSGVNIKTMANFCRIFADASNMTWTKGKDNIDRVYFETKGKVTRAGFNQKGHFLYSISSYQEEMLPKNILLMVRKNYAGKRIFGITEVNTLNKTLYLIMLDAATSWLHLTVLDGELTEEKVLLKTN